MRYLIGIGNYSMADDGIGLHLVGHIAEQGLNDDFEVIDLGDNGIRLLHYFSEETEQIVLIDAVLSGREPGDHFFFTPDEVESQKHLAAMSTHEGDILKIIELGRLTGLPVPKIRVMGIEPEKMEADMELSGCLKKRFPELVAAALQAMKA